MQTISQDMPGTEMRRSSGMLSVAFLPYLLATFLEKSSVKKRRSQYQPHSPPPHQVRGRLLLPMASASPTRLGGNPLAYLMLAAGFGFHSETHRPNPKGHSERNLVESRNLI